MIALLDPLLERDPENPAVLYMIGTALMRDKQYARGQRVLDRILSHGDSAEAHLLLALASREADDDIAAQRELEKALALNPKLPTANGMLGRRADADGRARRRRRRPSSASSRWIPTTSSRTCCSG